MSVERSKRRPGPAAELRDLLAGPPLLSLAVAESMTCGRVQAAIGGVSGASQYFLGGITTYTIAQKVRHLGVPAALAEQDNSVSAAVAAAMATGVCRLFGSDLGLATTGYAEPNPACGIVHPGAYWAIASSAPSGIRVVRHGFFEGHGLRRADMQAAVAEEVLHALADYVRMFRVAEKQSKFA